MLRKSYYKCPNYPIHSILPENVGVSPTQLGVTSPRNTELIEKFNLLPPGENYGNCENYKRHLFISNIPNGFPEVTSR